ncbi:MAG TPA: CDP-diacylglycerol--serine O-phosphatidyltransferase [Rubrobacteraceae bacterium]|jgi:CDP-diacylglycerol--serine O-phosphatidyltransferase|nr:CDP-diacylglycerol--serine O-phosphatidyltransferase [Rubrobacteraceae bacterium]
MKEYLTLANALTSGSLVAGFFAVLLVFSGDYYSAAGLISLAAVFDVLDGAAARRAGNEGTFGTNLDSLADVVSFGAAPALALYMSSLYTLPIVGVLSCLVFFLCGAWRLARFSTCKNPLYFVGCPIPGAGVLVAILAAFGIHQFLALPVVLVLGILMIGTMPFPTLSGLCNREELSEVVEEYRQARNA